MDSFWAIDFFALIGGPQIKKIGVRIGLREAGVVTFLCAGPCNQNCDDAYVKRQKNFEGFSQLRWRRFTPPPQIVLINRRSREYDNQLDD